MVKSICLATAQFEGPMINGGIGSYYNELAKLLSKNGWDVVVLFYPDEGMDIEAFARHYHDSYRIPVYNAIELCKESTEENITELQRDYIPGQFRSHVFHEAIRVLMKKYGYHFDLIEFSDWSGASYVPTNMKKNFDCYGKSRIIVKLHGPSQWHDEGCGQEWCSYKTMMTYYLEKYGFENADIQVSPSEHMLKWCGTHGWKVKPDISICHNPLSYNINLEAPKNLSERKEIVFFGRFEERKGLPEFIEALNYIRSVMPYFGIDYRVTFIGMEYRISKESIIKKLPGLSCQFFTLSRKEDAIKYLIDNARLVVIPSKVDNFPNTVLECMGSKVPFITSRAGGIPEMLGGMGSELYDRISCNASDPRELGRLIVNYLNYDERYVQKLIGWSHQRVKELTEPSKIVEWYDNKLSENQQIHPEGHAEGPGVTIIIPTRDLNVYKYLEATLESLLNQTYKNISIIVQDSSTDPRALKALDHLTQKYPSIKFNHRDNEGIGSALNQALPEVKTRYVMEVDGDNIARANMVETFVRCMEKRADLAGLSCYFASFTDGDEPRVLKSLTGRIRYKPGYYSKPLGMCLPVLFLMNTQGDANSMFLTDVLKSIGGWPEEKRLGFQDWSLWLKLLANGYEVDVIRKVLYFYRVHANNYIKSKKMYDADLINSEYIRELILKRPEFFYSSCYEGIQRLLRDDSLQKAQGGSSDGLDELRAIKSSTLYSIGSKIGNMASKHDGFKKMLTVSGKMVKKIIK